MTTFYYYNIPCDDGNYNENQCSQIILGYLFQIGRIQGRDAKIQILHLLFEFIVSHKDVLHNNIRFRDSTKKKLQELYKKQNWQEAESYYHQLDFGDINEEIYT
jgi:hypothetical protein